MTLRAAPALWRPAGVAGAPVSFGVFGGEAEGGVDADALFGAIRAAGYAGTELGPPGSLGPPGRLRALARRHGLTVVGAYVPLHTTEPDRWEEDFRLMRATLSELVSTGAPGALAILADWGNEGLRTAPARSPRDRSLALDARGWRTLADCVRRATDVVSAHGLTPSFHPHIATYVESPWEVERLLELTEIGLTLDTGHLSLAGASPARCLLDWGDRVNHVHLKDVRVRVLKAARDAGRADFEAWWAEVSCPPGRGDAGLEAFLEVLRGLDYRGWLVVEQDRAPAPVERYATIAREEAANVAWLAARLDGPGGPGPSQGG